MDRLLLHIITISLLLLVLPFNAFTQQSDLLYKRAFFKQEAYSVARAKIVSGYEANLGTDLKFGKIIVGESPVTVVVSIDGKRKISGKPDVNRGGYSPARYFIAGGDPVVCSVILPDKPVELSNDDKTRKVVVSEWDARLYSDNGGTSQSLIMGATLSIGGKEEIDAGVYTGSYNITFLYN